MHHLPARVSRATGWAIIEMRLRRRECAHTAFCDHRPTARRRYSYGQSLLSPACKNVGMACTDGLDGAAVVLGDRAGPQFNAATACRPRSKRALSGGAGGIGTSLPRLDGPCGIGTTYRVPIADGNQEQPCWSYHGLGLPRTRGGTLVLAPITPLLAWRTCRRSQSRQTDLVLLVHEK